MSEKHPELVYVSWGGTGRAAALRDAMNTASDTERSLLYLAILDDGTFGDVEEVMLGLAKDELSWLLDAQLELTKRQTGLQDVPVRVVVRSGDVADEIFDVVDAMGAAEVLIGGPIPEPAGDAVEALMALLNQKLDGPVRLLSP